VKTSIPEIQRLCDSNDIIFLQETWLASDELQLLSTMHDQFYSQGVSAMDVRDGICRGRPYGGLAVMWRKSLGGCEVIDMPTPRIMCLQIRNKDNAIALFNIYMPCDGRENLDEYLHLLSFLSTAIEEREFTHIAMIGDFNTTIDANSCFGKELKKFCGDEMLSISDSTWCDSKSFTFYSEAHQTVSWIDHCICNSNLHSAITDISILYNYVSSDHLPLHVSFDLEKTLIILTVKRHPTAMERFIGRS